MESIHEIWDVGITRKVLGQIPDNAPPPPEKSDCWCVHEPSEDDPPLVEGLTKREAEVAVLILNAIGFGMDEYAFPLDPDTTV